jgi:AcrR family transcriptional regulator
LAKRPSSKAKLQPSARKQTRNGRKGIDTRDRIITVARGILVDEGYDNFVVRQISARAGVRPGNLQYYFASKKELLQAVLEPELARYHETYASVVQDKSGKNEIMLAIVDFLLEEIRVKATCNIWYTVWTLASQDSDIASLMSDWYRAYLKELQSVIRTGDPTISERRAGHVASILVAIMDGLTMQIGFGKVPEQIHSGLESAVRTLFLDLVTQPNSAEMAQKL